MAWNRTPTRPLCDAPDFEAVEKRRSTLTDAWRDYLKVAIRPYSMSSFRRRYTQWRHDKRAAKKTAEEIVEGLNPTAEEFVASEQYWRNRSFPKSRIIVLRNSAGLRVANGSLELTEWLPRHLAPDGEPHIVTFNEYEARLGRRSAATITMPKAIILPEHGWSVTAEAVKFCLTHKISVASVTSRTSQNEKGLITIVAGDPFADAELLRAQARAKPPAIARAIVEQKIETCAALGRLAPRAAREVFAELKKARTLNQIMHVEARAATAYWAGRRCEVKSSSRRWPPHWAVFTTRSSSFGKMRSPRYADHPVNALLNWSYTVVAGRLSVELFARGACLAIGYLHVDKPGRFSLAYDALELLRPLIDEKVFDFVAKTKFRMGDFLVTPSGRLKGEVRVSQELLKVFAPAAFLPNDEISKAAEWMTETIESSRS